MAKVVKYISIQELAELSGKDKTTLRRWCQKDKVQYRIVDGNGGTRYEILVSSLDKKIQNIVALNSTSGSDNVHTISNKFKPAAGVSLGGNSEKKSNLLSVRQESCPAELSAEQEQALSLFGLNKIAEQYKITPESEKKKALARVDLIYALQEFRTNSKGNKTKSDKDFIELYNNGFIHKDIFKKLGKIGLSTLYRYEKIYKESNCDFYALIPNYSFGCESRLQSSLTANEKYLLLKYMLHQNCYSLGRAYQLIRLELNHIGEEQHSYSAYRHVWQYITRNYYAHIIYAREGLKACRDKALPYIIRKKDVLNFGDEIIGDGHTLDFMVQNPFNGKPCRATLIGFLDGASGDLVGYDIMLTENTQAIASALRNAIIYMGKYPKVVHLDNGKAFKSKYFTSTNSFTDSNIKGLYEKLGIKTLFSRAYNGRAKVIERFFKEFTESEAKTWNTYIGNNIDNKPAHTRRNEKFHAKLAGNYVPTIEEVKAGIDYWLNEVYRKRLSKTDDGLTIAEYVSQERGAGINIDELDDLMMTEEIRKIQRNGVKLFDTYYWNEKLFALNDRCIIKYSFFDISFIKVYSLQGEYICKAERMLECHPLAKQLGTAKDYEEYKYQSRNLSKIEKNVTSPMNKSLKQMYCNAPEHYFTPVPLAIETKYKEPENIIEIMPDTEEDYPLNTEFFGRLLAEKQAAI